MYMRCVYGNNITTVTSMQHRACCMIMLHGWLSTLGKSLTHHVHDSRTRHHSWHTRPAPPAAMDVHNSDADHLKAYKKSLCASPTCSRSRVVEDDVGVSCCRCISTPSGHETGNQANEDASEHPAKGSLEEHPLVEATDALEQGDTNGGTHLAVGGREGQTVVGTEDDDRRRAHLNAESTRR